MIYYTICQYECWAEGIQNNGGNHSTAYDFSEQKEWGTIWFTVGERGPMGYIVAMLQKLLLLGLAGACGTLARYGLVSITQRMVGSDFPWGTFAVNVAGCFVAGFLWIMFERFISISGETRIIVFVGFFGAFTTFSTLMLETGEMFRDAQWFYAIKNLALHNGFGLLSLLAGLSLGRLMKGV